MLKRVFSMTILLRTVLLHIAHSQRVKITKGFKFIVVGLFTIFILSGCASDPLTQSLKKYNYAPIMPLQATANVGDIYNTKGLLDPYIFMRDQLSDYIMQLMERIKDDASIPDVDGETQFNIGAETDIIGIAESELSAYGITKFKVRFSGVVQYIISKTMFEDELYK